jgi:excisionase family DNA binding protein
MAEVAATKSDSTTDRMTEDEAAAYLDLRPTTLASWRNKNVGPAYLKVGRLIRYRQADLDAWLNSRLVTPPSAVAQ